MSGKDDLPLLAGKKSSKPSVCDFENLMREARRQLDLEVYRELTHDDVRGLGWV